MEQPLSSQFTVTLPSDASKDYHPNNTLSSYRTHLATEIDLSSAKWQVALLNLHYPSMFLNVLENEMTGKLLVNGAGDWVDFVLPKGSYPDAQTFLTVLDEALKTASRDYIYLKKMVAMDQYEDPITIEINSRGTGAMSALVLSKPLAIVLGVFDGVKLTDKSTS